MVELSYLWIDFTHLVKLVQIVEKFEKLSQNIEKSARKAKPRLDVKASTSLRDAEGLSIGRERRNG